MMRHLVDPKHWKKLRREYMYCARQAKKCLTRKDGFWAYSETDEKVLKGVGKWVARARRAHKIALGRIPVIENFTYINDGKEYQGELFVKLKD